MARATWSGFISFGLVSVGVKLFTAVRSHDVHFTQLHEGSNARVRRKRIDEETGAEVPYDEIVKGYEVDGEYVVVDPDELEQLDPDASRTIAIRDFVDLEGIDPIYFDRPYYLAPDGEPAVRPYALLAEAMERSGKVAIAKLVMRNKEYLAAIRSRDGLLLLSTMHYADEVADPDDVTPRDVRDTEVDEREVAMAQQLIDQLVTEFDPAAYEDEYQERVLEFLDAKAAGERVRIPEPSEQPGGVTDLMTALEASLRGDAGDGELDPDGGSDAEATTDGDDLIDLTKDELYEIAQDRDISGRSEMTKDELADALQGADG